MNLYPQSAKEENKISGGFKKMDYLSDIGKCIVGATKDVYNAGVDAGIIDGDRIGSNRRKSLMFDDPNYGLHDDDGLSINVRVSSTYESSDNYDDDDCDYDDEDDYDEDPNRDAWLQDIREITDTIGKEIMKIQEQGFMLREIFWDPAMEHVTVLYEDPQKGRWLKSTINFEGKL